MARLAASMRERSTYSTSVPTSSGIGDSRRPSNSRPKDSRQSRFSGPSSISRSAIISARM